MEDEIINLDSILFYCIDCEDITEYIKCDNCKDN